MGCNYDRDRFTGQKILRPSLKLFGGKLKNRDLLYQLMPDNIDVYREPFLGTGGILLEAPGRVKYGYDINRDVINYYEILQTCPEEFWNKLQHYLKILYREGRDNKEHGRACFNVWKDLMRRPWGDHYWHQENRIAWAVLFYLITKHGWNGVWRRNKSGELNTPFCNQITGRGIFTRDWFDQVRVKIKDVKFTRCDYRYIFPQHSIRECETDFYMIDPPYRQTSKSSRQDYNGEAFTDKDHMELEYCLRMFRHSKWLLTINDDEFIRNLYKRYNIISHDIHYSCSQTPAGRGKRPELLIANYDIQSKFDGIRQKLDELEDRKNKRSGSRPVKI